MFGSLPLSDAYEEARSLGSRWNGRFKLWYRRWCCTVEGMKSMGCLNGILRAMPWGFGLIAHFYLNTNELIHESFVIIRQVLLVRFHSLICVLRPLVYYELNNIVNLAFYSCRKVEEYSRTWLWCLCGTFYCSDMMNEVEWNKYKNLNFLNGKVQMLTRKRHQAVYKYAGIIK